MYKRLNGEKYVFHENIPNGENSKVSESVPLAGKPLIQHLGVFCIYEYVKISILGHRHVHMLRMRALAPSHAQSRDISHALDTRNSVTVTVLEAA